MTGGPIFLRLVCLAAVAGMLAVSVWGICRCIRIRRVGRRPVYARATLSNVRWLSRTKYCPVVLNYDAEGRRYAVSYWFLKWIYEDVRDGMDVTIAYHPDHPGCPVVTDDWGFWRTALLVVALRLAEAAGVVIFALRFSIW